jgi:hypothetical protein
MKLLQFNPMDRISLDGALRHAYFVGPYTSRVDGSQHGTEEERNLHDRFLYSEEATGIDDGTIHVSRSSAVEDILEDDSSDLVDGDSHSNLVTSGSDSKESENYRNAVSRVDDMTAGQSSGEESQEYGDFAINTVDMSSEQEVYVFLDELDTNVEKAGEDVLRDISSSSDSDTADSLATHYHNISSAGDLFISDVDSLVSKLKFSCPGCGRVFPGDWAACRKHVHSRKHGSRCQYGESLAVSKNEKRAVAVGQRQVHEAAKLMSEETFSSSFRAGSSIASNDDGGDVAAAVINSEVAAVSVLPPCLSHSPLTPFDSNSGWCDLQGRSRYIEDMHNMDIVYSSHPDKSLGATSEAFQEDILQYKYFGVYDGHLGSRSAKFVARHLHRLFELEFYKAASKSTDDKAMSELDICQFPSDDLSVRYSSVEWNTSTQLALLKSANPSLDINNIGVPEPHSET